MCNAWLLLACFCCRCLLLLLLLLLLPPLLWLRLLLMVRTLLHGLAHRSWQMINGMNGSQRSIYCVSRCYVQ